MTLAQERDVWSEYQHATGADRERIEEELVNEHQNLAHFTARKYYSSQHEPEDVLQVAFIGLLKAVRGFDASTDMQFSTYAVKTMRRDIGHLIRDQYADKRKGDMDSISIHLNLNNDGERAITILDGIADQSDGPEQFADLVGTKQLIMQALSSVNESPRKYFLAHLDGMTFKDIAEAYGTTYRAVQVGVSKARRAVRSELEGLL